MIGEKVDGGNGKWFNRGIGERVNGVVRGSMEGLVRGSMERLARRSVRGLTGVSMEEWDNDGTVGRWYRCLRNRSECKRGKWGSRICANAPHTSCPI